MEHELLFFGLIARKRVYCKIQKQSHIINWIIPLQCNIFDLKKEGNSHTGSMDELWRHAK
jgi:hypothetical protein